MHWIGTLNNRRYRRRRGTLTAATLVLLDFFASVVPGESGESGAEMGTAIG